MNEVEARGAFPVVFELLDAENARQYPLAKFESISYEESEDGTVVEVWFTIPNSDKKLWSAVLVTDDEDDSFIEEYYER